MASILWQAVVQQFVGSSKMISATRSTLSHFLSLIMICRSGNFIYYENTNRQALRL